ncbi:hypothetical protein IW261DRAFT_1610511 [Armillaria novae-zelandiae]|uniref:Uncharacterized protein n=1 Tax=Armillaria novae-zelandiae TaxID=153914 RepID=A0AA39U573_9AGAR|nr:hypothetical protein IW261DRAFT_1610511 [Armillaria novae-zelandiae]
MLIRRVDRKSSPPCEFRRRMEDIKQELLDCIGDMPKHGIEYERNYDYNVSGGTLNHGMSVVNTAGTLWTDDEGPLSGAGASSASKFSSSSQTT